MSAEERAEEDDINIKRVGFEGKYEEGEVIVGGNNPPDDTDPSSEHYVRLNSLGEVLFSFVDQ